MQHLLKIYTVGNLLKASGATFPKNQRSIEQVFDSPQQARHAMTVCTAWLGFQTPAICTPIAAWWIHESVLPINSAPGINEDA